MEREALYHTLWKEISILLSWERDSIMSELQEIFATGGPDPKDLPLSVEQLKNIGCNGRKR
jgi:hypothetical protein